MPMSHAPAIDTSADLPCTCFRLRSAARRMTQVYEHALRPTGLKITQYSLLANLARSGSHSVTALARVLATDRTTLTRNLAPLERDGLVKITDGPDARPRFDPDDSRLASVAYQPIPFRTREPLPSIIRWS